MFVKSFECAKITNCTNFCPSIFADNNLRFENNVLKYNLDFESLFSKYFQSESRLQRLSRLRGGEKWVDTVFGEGLKIRLLAAVLALGGRASSQCVALRTYSSD